MEIEDYEYEIRRQKKWKNFNFAIAVIALLALVGLNYYYSNQLDSNAASYNSLYSRYSYQNGQISQLQQEMENMLQSYDQRSYEYVTPSANTTLGIWGLRAVVPPGQWTSWALLDTFVNHIDVSSNATAQYIIVDLQNFVQLYQNKPYVSLVNYNGTNFTHTERLSQGCSGYVLVILNHSSHPVLLTPNVTATYTPTSFLTGQCTLP
jgi:hypothetical protein